MTSEQGGGDGYAVEIGPEGSTWWMPYGTAEDDGVYCIRSASDGGYVLAGYTCAASGEWDGEYVGEQLWLVKTNPWGYMDWTRTYGDTGGVAYSVQATQDGGLCPRGGCRVSGWNDRRCVGQDRE